MPITNAQFNALNPTADINSVVNLVNQTGTMNSFAPELFYTKQLLETIRLGSDQYMYYRIADTSPIPDKAQKLQLRRWSPLQAHTVPLEEGIPPHSDKGSIETYEIAAFQYGRFMEFSDKVDLQLIDPIVANYSKEYSVVAVETLDLIARDTLMALAQTFFANQKANFTALEIGDKPSIADLRLIILAFKKNLVKPRMNGRFHVIASPEFIYDLITDPFVEQFMRFNNSTKTMYDNSALVPMFDMEFYETMATPNSGEYIDSTGKRALRVYSVAADGTITYGTLDEATYLKDATSMYVQDKRTGQDASYIPNRRVWDIASYGDGSYKELLVNHCIIVGKDALIRTGMSGEDSAKMYVKGKGTTGVIDPIDQRQSIGFKINSVGFGSARNEAIVDYMSVPTTLNMF